MKESDRDRRAGRGECEEGQAEVPAELWERLMRMISDAIVKKDF